ncbi:MAG: translation initiation factor IF-3 [Candidatus Liptonbacteria bacterium]|nr:translation initiation factor IF-3 [Candidatus Liptonbacteria bacterium]
MIKHKEQRINIKINNQITAKELRVIDEDGSNLGVLPLEKALQIAFSKNLDLIEIVPNALPPIARVISFDKFRYQKEKELKRQKIQSKVKELKYIQISGRSAQHDLLLKLKQLEKFVEKGHKVEVRLRLKGREKYNKDWAKQKLQEFIALVPENYQIIGEIKSDNKSLNIQIEKKR